MEKVVVVDHLSKDFEVIEKKQGLSGTIESLFSPQRKIIHALRDVSFNVASGELVGFIGPNGAGKTTTLKILSGLLFPTAGFTQVLGFKPWDRKPEYLKQITLVMGQKNQLWWDLPAIESFELNRAIYEIPRKDYIISLRELTNMLGVKDLLKTQVRRLSLGQRMKMELIASLIHQPKVMFLDEPTIGLDVIGQKAMRDFIFDYNKKHGATIILTSHNMDDVMDLAKRVIVVSGGGIIFDGNLEKLVKSFAEEKIITAYLSGSDNIRDLEKIGKVVSFDFPKVILSVPRQTVAVAASELLQNFPVSDLTIEEEQIEEIIRRVFKGGKISGSL